MESDIKEETKLMAVHCCAGVVARVESLRGRMGESERQVEGLFESLLSQSFGI